jgi:septation ring formation regulator EzrA
LDKLNLIDERISQLAEHFEREKASILQQIEDRGRELAEMLQKFKEEFDHDRELRLARDLAMVKQLSDHEHSVSEKFQKQIASRLLCVLLTDSRLLGRQDTPPSVWSWRTIFV